MKILTAIHNRLGARASVACALVASIAGCAALKTPESQLFADRGPYQSASIIYRVERIATPKTPPGPPWSTFLDSKAGIARGERRTTLAVRYPHPSGRAGYARVECIVATAPPAAAARTALSAWLLRARQLADDTLPGIALGDGIESARALDVPIADLERVIARLQQPDTSSAASPGPARMIATLNGVALPARSERVTELDQLVARVRREGSIVSHRARSVEPDLIPEDAALAAKATLPGATDPGALAKTSMPQKAATQSQPADQPVIAASYAQPTIRRLPPVDPIAR